MASDAELLEEYTRQKSEAAFAELVRRYVNLVHGAALRQVRDAHLAEDVTQAVFIVLAKKAGSMCGEYLAGWLLRTARFCAADATKARNRRVLHEQRAADMQSISIAPADSSPGEIAEFLDEALARLNEKESAAVALRFFQNKTSADVAASLGVSQDAAQKVIARALPKLRRMLVAKGLVLSGTSGIAELMLSASRQTAPGNFAVHISTGNLAIAKGAMHIMFLTKIKTAGAVAAAVLVVGGGMGMVLIQRDGNAHAAISTAPPAAAAAHANSVQPFASPFLELSGCRIFEPVDVVFHLMASATAPAATARAYEQEELSVNFSVPADLSTKGWVTGSIVSSDDGSEVVNFGTADFTPLNGGGVWLAMQGSFFRRVPEPGDYLIKMEALDADKHRIASAVVPLHVDPLPPTQIMIDDVQADGTIRFTSVLQGLNTTNSPHREDGFMNSDFVNVTGMTDNEGEPIQFTTRHEHGHYIYHYRLNTPVPPGQAVMGSTSGTMEGLVSKIGADLFQYSMDHTPGGNQPVRRIELYRLPPGAKLISTVPADLPHRIIDGRMQIIMETMIPPGGSNLVSFRYRLPR